MPAKGRRPHWGKHPTFGSLQQCRAGLTPQGALSKATDILAMQDRASSLVFRQLEGPLTYLPPANPFFPLWNTGSKRGALPLHVALQPAFAYCWVCKARRAGATIPACVRALSGNHSCTLSGPMDSPQQNNQARKALSSRIKMASVAVSSVWRSRAVPMA